MQYIKYSPVPGVKTKTAKLFRKNFQSLQIVRKVQFKMKRL